MMPFRLKPEISVSPCLTCLAKMRRNTITYWRDADFANRKTYSFIRLNDAFGKTLLKAARKESRKLTNHLKQLLSRALISNEKKKNRIINICFFTYCSLLGDLCTEIQMRLLLKKTHGGTFLEIQIDIYINISSRTYENCARCQL